VTINGFDLSPGADMIIGKDGRTVFTSAGRMATLLPSANDFGTDASPQSVTLTYADVSKGWLYNWRWQSNYVAGSSGQQYNLGERGDTFISAFAGESSSTTILTAAPADCNVFIGKVKLSRPTAPNKTWLGNTIAVKPPENVWIPFNGSLLLEEQVGLARAFSIYIDGSGNLVLHQQQSVSVPPAFSETDTGDHTLYYGASSGPDGTHSTTASGGEWAHSGASGAAIGLPVYNDASLSVAKTYLVSLFTPGVGNPDNRCRRTTNSAFVGSQAAPVSPDPTNYSSVYSLQIAGKFGRISS